MLSPSTQDGIAYWTARRLDALPDAFDSVCVTVQAHGPALANTPSVAIARALGYADVATAFAVRLRT